jgi:hypothetical protein
MNTYFYTVGTTNFHRKSGIGPILSGPEVMVELFRFQFLMATFLFSDLPDQNPLGRVSHG